MMGLVTFSLPGMLRAQTIIPATGIEIPITASWAANSNNDVVVNNDMLEFVGLNAVTGQIMNGFIHAIVYGKRFSPAGLGGTESFLWVQDNLGSTATIQLPDSAIEPDVAIAEYDSGGTVLYKVCVVYNYSPYTGGYLVRNPHFAVYYLWGVNTGSLNLALMNDTKLSGATCGATPHIDLWSDAVHTNPISGNPTLHKYGIVWSDDSLNSELILAKGDLTILGSLTFPIRPLFNTDCYMPDVTCVTDPRGNDLMEITYGHSNSYAYTHGTQYFQLMHGEYNTTTSNWSVAPTQVEDSIEVYAPRIEAMSQYDGTSAKWQIAADVKFVRSVGPPGTIPPGILQDLPCGQPSVWMVAGYNDFTGIEPKSYSTNTCASGLLPAPMGTQHQDVSVPQFITEDVKGACVAAGISPGFNSNIGNQQYTIGFFPWQSSSNHTRYARAVDPLTGIMPNLDFYEVNTNGFPVNYPWDADKAMAISSCSNTGLDLFASWFNGSNVVYKHPNPNIMTFRMTKPGSAT
ncbi:MAG: hypothetical protein JST06_09975 [Bacteroidetes bacterium]|nr:hypothetical protein [Bacteroidota bacterium]